MYQFIVFIVFSGFISQAPSQKVDPISLENKIFSIDNYINGKLDNSEDVIFLDGKMEGTICTEYGFQGADYIVTKKHKKFLEFECTMYSEKEGKMKWEGKAFKNKIEGTCLWIKEGQDDILLTFNGKLKS